MKFDRKHSTSQIPFLCVFMYVCMYACMYVYVCKSEIVAYRYVYGTDVHSCRDRY